MFKRVVWHSDILTFFLDVCKECQHVVATHKYTFSLSRDYQVRILSKIFFDFMHMVSSRYMCVLFCRNTQCSATCVDVGVTQSVSCLMIPGRKLCFSIAFFCLFRQINFVH